MDEYKLQDIWKKNLREFNDVMRLDSIIIRAMQEAIKEAQTEQLISSGVMPRICHFVSEIGQQYQADDEAVLIEIQDGNLRFYEIGYDFERIYLTPIYVA